MQSEPLIKKDKPKKLPIPVKLTVGALAGAFGTSCIFPIDMIKTRLQASSGRYTGPLDCFRQIMANEGGVRGFYKGLGPNLGGVCPEKAIKLVTIVVAEIFLLLQRFLHRTDLQLWLFLSFCCSSRLAMNSLESASRKRTDLSSLFMKFCPAQGQDSAKVCAYAEFPKILEDICN